MHRGDDSAPAVMKPAKCVLKTWQRACAHNCLTCRVTLLFNPPLKRFFFSTVGAGKHWCYICGHPVSMRWLDRKSGCSAGRGWSHKAEQFPPSLIQPSCHSPPQHTHRVPEMSLSSDANDVYTWWVFVFFTVFTVDIPCVLFVFIYE